MKATAIVATASLSAMAAVVLMLTLVQYTASIDPGVDPIVSSAIPARNFAPDQNTRAIFTVSNIGARTVCVVERGAVLTGRSRIFDAPADCESVWPGLAAARNWTENGDGTVTLSDAQGQQLLVLGPAEGFDFGAIEPVGADLSLLELR